MKKILNILLGILMAITVVLMVYAIATGGSDASISVNLMWVTSSSCSLSLRPFSAPFSE